VLGSTGNGKSTWINSLLRKTVFEAKSNPGGSGVTKEFALATGERLGRMLRVADSPGTGDGENFI
jgi:predicted GTPase